MSSAKEAANEYKLTLDELVNNNKTQINLLTILAEDYQQHAAAIVETIEKQIFTQKLPIMYVADSIMKNVPNSDYRDLFAKIIVRVFLHVFLEGDETVRSAMYRLRQTWGDIFNRSKLYQLDIKVNEVDRAWPLTALKQGAKPPVITNPAPTYFSKDGVVKPTAILGAHAFTVQAKTSLNRAQQQLPLQGRSSPVSNGLPIPAAHVPQHPATGNGLPMPPTFHVPTTISNSGAAVAGPAGLPMPPNYVPPTATSTAVPIQGPQARGPSGFPMPPGYRPATSSPALPPAPQIPSGSNAVSAEVPTKLDIPSNNRIFVDGKAHEVEYVNDIAVIERNGLPHKIFFAGTPRNVILDGVPHLLHFGESKAVVIDGQEHILRFGAPSRELYLNNFAFRGQFGGAPIVATINGRRHEIRLAGPAPDVKINPDPAYELTAELNRIRASKSENKNYQSSIISFNFRHLEPSLDPFNLLKKLQQSGFLKKPEPAPAPAPNPSTRDRLRHNNTMLRDSTPPIPSEHSVSVVERRSIPTAPLKEFNMRTLKIRYDTVVDALHEKQQNACPHCGQRMELRGERYERHLDWHVKRNLKTFEKANASRPWYASSKNCVVCCEEFEEYCDEDDDGVWKLKDCIIVNNQVCLFWMLCLTF
uniref:CID domain-containing protein n=1 Tax=Angiostrongylus cantonensis TaxID=6313 RepID=A0A158P835_ANGCA